MGFSYFLGSLLTGQRFELLLENKVNVASFGPSAAAASLLPELKHAHNPCLHRPTSPDTPDLPLEAHLAPLLLQGNSRQYRCVPRLPSAAHSCCLHPSLLSPLLSSPLHRLSLGPPPSLPLSLLSPSLPSPLSLTPTRTRHTSSLPATVRAGG